MHGADDLDAFLDGLPDLDQAVLLLLSVRPSVEEANALRDARRTARRVAKSIGRGNDLDRLRGEIVTWSGANGARSAIWAPDLTSSDVLLADTRRGAAQAILDAATAELLGESLGSGTRAVLRSRWDNVSDSPVDPSRDG
jgi:hypothetical protein